ncbi:MAG: AmmeMemoRadiSam system protein A [Candidatus Firestonebacteria bacterium]
MLSEAEGKELLGIARETLERDLLGKKYKVKVPKSGALNEKRGAFVTLNAKNGELRGCIGLMLSNSPLYETVSEMAHEAAFGDPRFKPVKKNELKDLLLEISVLTLFKRVNDIKEIVLGRHGVMVRSGSRSGVFLPQVAVETGWGLDEFMANLCAGKAGLSPLAWKNGSAELYTFEAEIVRE